jgi:hypothetical protein
MDSEIIFILPFRRDRRGEKMSGAGGARFRWGYEAGAVGTIARLIPEWEIANARPEPPRRTGWNAQLQE